MRQNKSQTILSGATMHDIARVASVSTATVSRVLNGSGTTIPISEKTRDLVLRTARELQYQPNYAARTLRSSKTRILGVIVADLMNPAYLQVLRGIEAATCEYGYLHVLSNAEDSKDREEYFLNLLHQKRVDGVIVVGVTNFVETEKKWEMFLENGIPHGLIGFCYDKKEIIPSVEIESRISARLAVEHLLSLGHTRIAHISDIPEKGVKPIFGYFLEGYKLALEAVGCNFDPDLVVGNGENAQSGYDAMIQLLELKRRPTAVFCCNDLVAMGALHALHDRGISVPTEMSVVGFDDVDFIASHTSPPLTTVHVPYYDMGYKVTKMLIEFLEHPNSTKIERLVLETELIVRSSTSSCDIQKL
jgi:LacI family transcriptional regulator